MLEGHCKKRVFLPSSSVLFILDIAFFISYWSFFIVSMSFYILLSIPIVITLNYLCDKLYDSLSYSSSGGFSCPLITACLSSHFCLPYCVSFYVLGRSAKTLLQTCVRHCMWLALSNLFGAISDPQPVAFNAGHLCVRREPGYAAMLAFISISPSGVSAVLSELPEIHLRC